MTRTDGGETVVGKGGTMRGARTAAAGVGTRTIKKSRIVDDTARGVLVGNMGATINTNVDGSDHTADRTLLHDPMTAPMTSLECAKSVVTTTVERGALGVVIARRSLRLVRMTGENTTNLTDDTETTGRSHYSGPATMDVSGTFTRHPLRLPPMKNLPNLAAVVVILPNKMIATVRRPPPRAVLRRGSGHYHL